MDLYLRGNSMKDVSAKLRIPLSTVKKWAVDNAWTAAKARLERLITAKTIDRVRGDITQVYNELDQQYTGLLLRLSRTLDGLDMEGQKIIKSDGTERGPLHVASADSVLWLMLRALDGRKALADAAIDSLTDRPRLSAAGLKFSHTDPKDKPPLPGATGRVYGTDAQQEILDRIGNLRAFALPKDKP
jgi:hypothetical protein